MQKVFVIDTNKQVLNPCTAMVARLLLRDGKAAVYRKYPFTIILKRAVADASPDPLRVKIDPGSKTTGVVVVNDATGEVVFGAEVEHRGAAVKEKLEKRRSLRSSRRSRKTRHRQKRFDHRTRKAGWLPPSIESRIFNIETWVKRLMRVAPIRAISQELVRFDTQAMQNPQVSGKEYQQGTLVGYETKEYLLEKWDRCCAYCGKKDVPLEVEHIQPRSKGGTDRVSNLTLACRPCNEKKSNIPVEEFLKNKPEVLKKIKAQAKAPLKDTASVNASRWELFNRLKATGLDVEVGTGGRTKFNRTQQNLPKAHWIDAACVGASTPDKLNIEGVKPLVVKAVGHGDRQMTRVNKYGFPCSAPKSVKRIFGFQSGDQAKLVQPSGKYKGVHFGKVSIRATGKFDLKNKTVCITSKYTNFTNLWKADGYLYASR